MNRVSKKNSRCRACQLLMPIGLFLPLLGNAAFAETIDISKPVSESLKPDGIYWTFDNGTVGESFPVSVEDVSGNGYEGTLKEGRIRPAPVYIKGKFGTAIHFLPAPDGSVVNLSNPNPTVSWKLRDTPGIWNETALDMNNKSFTAGAWIKLDRINSGERQVIFLMQRGSTSRQWHFLLIKEPSDVWSLNMNGSASSEKTTELNDGAWHHVAFSFEAGEERMNLITFWLDGQQLGEPVENDKVIAAPESQGERSFIVGERNMANYSQGFVGDLDEVFVTSGIHAFKSNE